jgi:C1A family cysteine protease
MARRGTTDNQPDESEISGFGGHPLITESGEARGLEAGDGVHSDLSALGLVDAEQVIAAASVPGVAEELQSALGVDSETLQSLLDAALSALPAERAALVSQPAPRDLGLGVIPPTEEMIAAAEATAVEDRAVEEAAISLPPAVNLVPYMSPIRSQGSRGTCVSFTLTALNEYVLRRRGLDRDLSEQHLYAEIKAIDGASSSCGTWQVKAVNALRDRGQCRESTWPYNPNPPCNNHGVRPAQARPDGLNYRLNTFQVAARNVAAYKAELAKQRPVTLSVPVYNSWYQSAETRRSGRITMRVGNEPVAGGHAVCLVGYQDSASSPGGGYFIVRNSWSINWANQSPYGPGYGTIPYRYITNDAYEAFSAVVPNVGDDGEDEPDATTTTKSSVVIQVGSTVKITIESE